VYNTLFQREKTCQPPRKMHGWFAFGWQGGHNRGDGRMPGVLLVGLSVAPSGGAGDSALKGKPGFIKKHMLEGVRRGRHGTAGMTEKRTPIYSCFRYGEKTVYFQKLTSRWKFTEKIDIQ